MFTEREDGKSIIFVRSGPRLKDSVNDGDQVVLKVDSESVIINDVKALDNNKYEGTVSGFEPSYSEQFKNISIGDLVEFTSKHIISCSSK